MQCGSVFDCCEAVVVEEALGARIIDGFVLTAKDSLPEAEEWERHLDCLLRPWRSVIFSSPGIALYFVVDRYGERAAQSSILADWIHGF